MKDNLFVDPQICKSFGKSHKLKKVTQKRI